MPAQRLITQAEYIALTDNVARMIQVLQTAIGDEDTPATAAAYAAAVRNTITAFADPDEAKITIDLLIAARDMVTNVGNLARIATYVAGFNSAVLSHLGSDLNAWLTTGGLRVHPLFRQGGNASILPVNVFPPATVLGTVAVTGAGAGLLTLDPTTLGRINSALYADAQLEVKVINQQLGASQIVMSLVGTDFDGVAQGPHAATITSEAAQNAVFEVGTGSDRYARLISMTFTGGTAGDDLQIQSKVDRSL
jgi:hypothetical protein